MLIGGSCHALQILGNALFRIMTLFDKHLETSNLFFDQFAKQCDLEAKLDNSLPIPWIFSQIHITIFQEKWEVGNFPAILPLICICITLH